MSADTIAPLIADIHLLTVLAETRSFTLAAQRLGLSKASVSMRITQLERQVGLALVHRTTRAVGLTDAGLQLVTDCAPAFARIGAGYDAVRDLSGTPRGTIRITAPVALGRQHLAPRLTTFLQQYPAIQIQLDLSDRFVNLAHEGFDLAIRHTSQPPENYVAWPLCQTQSCLVASRDYLQRRGTPTHPSQLVDHDCLLYLGRGHGTDTWTFIANDPTTAPDPVPVQIRGPFKANNSEVLRDAVGAGLGIGLLPDFSATASAGKGLQPVLPDWHVQGFFGDTIFALRPWSPRVPRAIECLVAFLRHSFHQDQGFNTTL